MRIFLDDPAGAIESSFFYLRGWAAEEGALPQLRITVNGLPVEPFFYLRPDVAKSFPACATSGFSAFVRLADLPYGDRVEIRISAADTVYERQASVTAEAHAAIARDQQARQEKRAWILSRVACPNCGGDLTEEATCRSCGACYATGASEALNFTPPGSPLASFEGAVCSHGYDGDVERVIRRAEASGGKTLDCGAGMRPTVRRTVVTTEVFDNPSTDVIAFNQRLPFKDNVFDAVLSLHVLEHVPDPFLCAKELTRVLKPGGTIYAVTPMIVPEHGYPHHFFNPTREGLAQLFQVNPADAQISIPPIGHPVNGVHTILNRYQQSLPEAQREKFLSMNIRDLLAQSIEHWITQDIATAMREEDRPALAANFAIEIVKR